MEYLGEHQATDQVIVRMNATHYQILQDFAIAISGLELAYDSSMMPSPDYTMAFLLIRDIAESISGHRTGKPLFGIEVQSDIRVFGEMEYGEK